MPTPSVHVRGLTKNYGTFQAVKGVDFEIFPGEVFGLLGPNGAGNEHGNPGRPPAARRR
jgi:ABC-type multidrug transport system ATPase subunit